MAPPLCAAVVSALLWGCGVDQGFKDLGDQLISPDIGYIDSPGRHIASGNFHRFSVRSPTLEDRYIAAFEGSKLVLIRFEENGAKCEIGKASSFGNSIGTDSADQREPLLPYLVARNAQGRGELKFSNFSCASRDFSVPDVPLPRDFLLGTDDFHMIAQDGSGALLAIDPWANKAVQLAPEASFYQIRGERLWSIEAGQLVLRDAKLHELGRIGQAVTEAATSRNWTANWAAFVDGGKASLVTEGKFDKPVSLADDVCGLSQVGSSTEQVFRFFSPCANRHLVLFDAGAKKRYEYVDNVVTTGVVARAETGFDLNYWTGTESGRGTLWIALAGKPAVNVFDDALVEPNALFRTSAFSITNWDGEKGDYTSWHNGTTTTLATGVAELNNLGLIANFANGTGDLLEMHDDGTSLKLGSGVPLDATHGWAFVGNAKNSRGDLFVLEESNSKPRKVASGVAPHAFLFSVQIDTLLMMLSDYDTPTGTATLQVRLIDTGDQFAVSTGVSELVEVGFPRPGVLYGVPNGANAGLWFAGVR
ncbi:MAG TPA: hypothetical protein VL137_08930 [Polyangiaceae bacterium]|nr:hypothetical protein [Polyangiaceae bacterium]